MAEMTPQRLFQLLAAPPGNSRKGRVGCVVLAGEDAYLRDLSRKGIVTACFPEGAPEWAVVRVSLRDEGFDHILAMAQSYPMLASRQILFALDLEALEELDESAREAARERLAAYLEDPAPFTLLVLEAASLDQRTKLSRLLAEKAVIVSLDLADAGPRKTQEAIPVIMQMARAAGVCIEAEAAAQLADCLDGGLERIAPEVAKLAAYAGEGKSITQADLAALVPAAKRYSVWQLAEILATGERGRALHFLDSLLREGEEPVALVGAMAWMYRKLIEVQELPPGTNQYAAAGKLRMRPATVELAQRQSRAVPRERLLRGIQALAEADSKLKSGNRAARVVLEFLITELTAPGAAASRTSAS
jgi:DNA polymerase-3 subunit delta